MQTETVAQFSEKNPSVPVRRVEVDQLTAFRQGFQFATANKICVGDARHVAALSEPLH